MSVCIAESAFPQYLYFISVDKLINASALCERNIDWRSVSVGVRSIITRGSQNEHRRIACFRRQK